MQLFNNAPTSALLTALTASMLITIPMHGMSNTIAPANPKQYTVAKILPLPKDLQNIVFEYTKELRLKADLCGADQWTYTTQLSDDGTEIVTASTDIDNVKAAQFIAIMRCLLPHQLTTDQMQIEAQNFIEALLIQEFNNLADRTIASSSGIHKVQLISIFIKINKKRRKITLTNLILKDPTIENLHANKWLMINTKRNTDASSNVTIAADSSLPIWQPGTSGKEENYIRAEEQKAYTESYLSPSLADTQVTAIQTSPSFAKTQASDPQAKKAKNKTNCCVIF